jgi:hypothetical protein
MENKKCDYCDTERGHYFFPEVTICVEKPVSDLYWNDLKRTDNILEFIEKYKYLCPDINHEGVCHGKFRYVQSLRASKFTDEFVLPSIKGDEEAIKYVNLIFPRNLTILGCVTRGSWSGSPSLKAVNSSHAFLVLKQEGYLTINDKGFIAIKGNQVN